MDGKSVVKVLLLHDFEQQNNNGGSHFKFRSSDTSKVVMVGAGHCGRDIPKGTLCDIWRQAGLEYLKGIKSFKEAKAKFRDKQYH